MRKRILFILLVSMLTMPVMKATTVTITQAMETARQFAARHHSLRSPQDVPSLKLAYVARNIQYDDYYVFNLGENNGFIIVGGDDIAAPVWGYSEVGAFDINVLPDNMRGWLEDYQRQLQWLRAHPDAARKAPARATSVDPLLQVQWGQSLPFNRYCPILNGARTVTGCVATAAAQIMKYYTWPQTGAGNNSYSYMLGNGETVSLSADFSQSQYRWIKMKKNYKASYTTEQANAVARLMSDVGIALNTRYNVNGSSASSISLLHGLVAYFDYDPSISFVERDSYTGDWDAMLRGELDASRPVLYSGVTSSYEGHLFVIDGYSSDSYFHVNWGWEGNCDGYFLTTLLSPFYDCDFSFIQAATIGIQPDNTNSGGIVLKSDIKVAADTMPASAVKASFDVAAYSGSYNGTLKLVIARKIDDSTYGWNGSSIFWIDVSLADGERKTINVDGSFCLDEGETYYLIMMNPYLPNDNYRWSNIAPFIVAEEPSIVGDVNDDGEVNIADINAIISAVISSSCSSECDVNGDGEITIADVNAVVDIILR